MFTKSRHLNTVWWPTLEARFAAKRKNCICQEYCNCGISIWSKTAGFCSLVGRPESTEAETKPVREKEFDGIPTQLDTTQLDKLTSPQNNNPAHSSTVHQQFRLNRILLTLFHHPFVEMVQLLSLARDVTSQLCRYASQDVNSSQLHWPTCDRHKPSDKPMQLTSWLYIGMPVHIPAIGLLKSLRPNPGLPMGSMDMPGVQKQPGIDEQRPWSPEQDLCTCTPVGLHAPRFMCLTSSACLHSQPLSLRSRPGKV